MRVPGNGLCICMLALAATPAHALPVDAAPSQLTAQQIYDGAESAFEKADWPAAIKGFASIAGSDDGRVVTNDQGIIHSRLSQAYAHMHLLADATLHARLATKGLGLRDDLERAALWITLADAQRSDFDIQAAVDSYNQGLAAAQSANNRDLVARTEASLALCYMTSDPDKAAALLDAVLSDPEFASFSQEHRAQYTDLRGRADLNRGRALEAKPYLAKAVELSGGLKGTQVNLLQIGIRGDAAIGAFLLNDKKSAQQYLTWTGAGRLPSAEWTLGLGNPPVCSEASDIRPDDSVIVEFSIAADGHVTGASPIFVSRPGTNGIAFARAVSEWRWNPERIQGLSPFWRTMIRIELHCIPRPLPHDLGSPYARETRAWLAQQHLPAEDLALFTMSYVPKDDPRLAREDLAAIPALFARLRIESDYRRKESIFSHLISALDKANGPASTYAFALNQEPVDPLAPIDSADRVRKRARHVEIMERRFPQTSASAWINLEYAISLEFQGHFKDAQPVLERVLAYPAEVLKQDDPVRNVATLHLAALQRRAGDAAGADAHIKDAGLTRAQCMLFDVRPVLMAGSVRAIKPPAEMLDWGLDGIVRETFDIASDGHVENVRTTIAYPPFVYRAAAERQVAQYRYIAPAIDGVPAGCEGHTTMVGYGSPF